MAARNGAKVLTRSFSNTAAAPYTIRKTAEESTSTATWKHYKIVSGAMIAGCFGVAYSAFSQPHPIHPPYVNYSHLHIRRKAFPWDQSCGGTGESLFHFYTVPLPGGKDYHPNVHH